MALVQTPSEIVDDPRRLMHLLYGEAGTGKTTFASQIPGHYFIKAEEGTPGVRVYGESCPDWETFVRICKDLVEAKKGGWKDQREVTTVVVDVYEALWEHCGVWVCANETFMEKGRPQKFDKLTDIPYQAGNKRVTQLVLGSLKKLQLYGFGVFILSHERGKVIQWAGRDVIKYGPNLSATPADALVDACDCVGFFKIVQHVESVDGRPVHVEDGRYIYWQPGFTYVAKHRYDVPAQFKASKDTMWQDYVQQFNEAVRRMNSKEV